MSFGAGRVIEVLREPAYWVEHAGGNSVRYVRPGSDTILLAHETDIREQWQIQQGQVMSVQG